MTKKLQELIEELENMDCPLDHGGDECCWTEYASVKARLSDVVIGKVQQIAQLAEEEALEAKAEQLKVMLGGEFAQALDNWTPEDFIFFIQKPLSNQKEDDK